MNTLKNMRLREEGSLNDERPFKRAIVQKCDWAYEDFQTAEMVQDSTMRLLQGRFRKEDDENVCLQKSIDTLTTVVRIVRRTLELHKFHNAHLYKNSEETTYLVIAKVVNKVVEKYLQSMDLSNSLKFWRHLDDWLDDSVEIVDPIPEPYPMSQNVEYTRTMNTLRYIRLREEGSLNERTLKRETVQKRDWAYEDFQTAEMVQDSTMRMLQGRFRKEDHENTCLQKSVDTLVTVGRIVRRTREIRKLYYAKLSKDSEETICSIIAEMVNKVVEKYFQSLSLSDTLKFWQFLDDPNRENCFSIDNPYVQQILDYYAIVLPKN